MRILLSCLQSPQRHAIPAYAFWREYFREGLREAGHTVLEVEGVDWARGLLPLDEAEAAAWRSEAWGRTLDVARRERAGVGLDLFLGYLYPRQVEPSAVRALRDLGVPTVNFFCDHVREFRRLPEQFGAFDLHWVPEYKALPLYRARGWRHVYAPMPCWVPPARRELRLAERPVVSFIGRRDPLRAALLAEVAGGGLPLEVRGVGWGPAETEPTSAPRPAPSAAARWRDWREFVARQGVRAAARRLFGRAAAAEPAFDFSAFAQPSPEADAYAEVVASSAVSLGINRYPSFRHSATRPDTYSRLRDIEAPMLGACYLTEWTAGLDELYDIEREIAVYRSSDELVATARALLADAPRRARLRRAAQARALSAHTVGRSLARLAAALGLPHSPARTSA